MTLGKQRRNGAVIAPDHYLSPGLNGTGEILWETAGCLNRSHSLDLDPPLATAAEVTQLLSLITGSSSLSHLCVSSLL